MNEAELLFTHVLNCNRTDLYLNKDSYLDKDKSVFISHVLSRRIKGEPVQYILGKTEFMGLEIKVNKDVLIPRPETEILVTTCLSYLGTPLAPIGRVSPRILDLGTGSGCIAVSLAKNLTHSLIDASDISETAMVVARENAALNKVKVSFIISDLFSNIKYRQYDLIVSNPPYVAQGQIKALQPELQFEPDISLSGGSDGLSYYRSIISKAAAYLKKEGLLIMEMGFNQKESLVEIVKKSGGFKIIELIKDYNCIERVIVLRKVDKNG